MPALNKLTDARLRSLKPGPKAKKHSDGAGLYLFVSPTGAKSWRVGYRLHGAEQTAALGLYPDVSLAEARVKRDDLKAKLRAGEDPREVRTRSVPDLKTVIEAYWAGRDDVTQGYRDSALSCMARVFYPTLGRRAVNTIEQDDVMAALGPFNDAKKYDYVRKGRGWLSQVLDYAIQHKWTRHNAAAGINPRRAFGHKRVEHFASLRLHEVGDFLRRLDLEGDLLSVLACRFIALTWVRTKEARLAKFSDIRDGVWTIDESVMKKRREHVVPLSPQALALVERIRALQFGGDLLFPGDRTPDRPISDSTVLALIHRMGYKGKMTGHGWRSVASTWANEAGYSPDAIERQLAHAPNDKVRSAYNRAQFLAERREMLAAWANWLDEQGAEAAPAAHPSTG